MNKLFVHNIWFRLLSPLFTGIMVYLLILLLNDSVLSIQEDFLGQELYVCIGLAYVTHEFSRISLLAFKRLKRPRSFGLRVVLQLLLSVVLTIFLVSISMYFYFKYILLYTPNFRELYVFNSIFSFITIIYMVLYLGHYFLYRRNTTKMAEEELAKISIESDFQNYKAGINPELLFESLEAMLVTMKSDADKAEALADQFSTVYRYILSKKNTELVFLNDEVEIVKHLAELFSNLPFRKIKIKNASVDNPLIVPTTLLTIVEAIIRSTIASKKNDLSILLSETDNSIILQYEPEERLNKILDLDAISSVTRSYQFYSESSIRIQINETLKSIELPKLNYHEGSHP